MKQVGDIVRFRSGGQEYTGTVQTVTDRKQLELRCADFPATVVTRDPAAVVLLERAPAAVVHETVGAAIVASIYQEPERWSQDGDCFEQDYSPGLMSNSRAIRLDMFPGNGPFCLIWPLTISGQGTLKPSLTISERHQIRAAWKDWQAWKLTGAMPEPSRPRPKRQRLRRWVRFLRWVRWI